MYNDDWTHTTAWFGAAISTMILAAWSACYMILWSFLFTSPPEGLRGIVFTLSVCLCVCPANILVFYLSAIRWDIDLKFIQDTHTVVLNSQKNIDLHRSKAKVTGMVHCFLKVQSYHKNWVVEKCRHLLGYSIRWNIKNWSEQRNDVTKNTSIFDFNM